MAQKLVSICPRCGRKHIVRKKKVKYRQCGNRDCRAALPPPVPVWMSAPVLDVSESESRFEIPPEPAPAPNPETDELGPGPDLGPVPESTFELEPAQNTVREKPWYENPFDMALHLQAVKNSDEKKQKQELDRKLGELEERIEKLYEKPTVKPLSPAPPPPVKASKISTSPAYVILPPEPHTDVKPPPPPPKLPIPTDIMQRWNDLQKKWDELKEQENLLSKEKENIEKESKTMHTLTTEFRKAQKRITEIDNELKNVRKGLSDIEQVVVAIREAHPDIVSSQ